MDFDDIMYEKLDRTEDYVFFVGLKTAAPEMLGVAEGQFAAPLENVVQALAAMVAHEFKLSQSYEYYSEMLRGIEQRPLAELFRELGYAERNDAPYFLRRIAALQPGGVPIPMIPPPEPMPDAMAMLDTMIAAEQQGIMMLRQLRELAGENPMRYEIESRLAEEQTHLDKLWQFKPAGLPAKVAFAMEMLRHKRSNEFLIAEQGQALAQAQNENAFLADQLAQTRDQLLAASDQAQQAGASVEEAQAQAQQAVMQADAAQQEALAGQTAAAEHANAKLRLAQRIQQMRQALADLAAQDPVAEEGVGVDPTMTSTQMDAAAQAQAQDPNAQPGTDPTQQAPAQQPPAGGAQAGGTNITVKAANVVSAAARREALADLSNLGRAYTTMPVYLADVVGQLVTGKHEPILGASRRLMEMGVPENALAGAIHAGGVAAHAAPVAAAYGAGRYMGSRASAVPPEEKISQNLASAATSLAKKLRPTQAITPVAPMAAARHMAQHSPSLAIQAGRQGAPVVGNAKVLEELSRSSFGKLSSFWGDASPLMRGVLGAVPGAAIGGSLGYAAAPEDRRVAGTLAGAALGGIAGGALARTAPDVDSVLAHGSQPLNWDRAADAAGAFEDASDAAMRAMRNHARKSEAHQLARKAQEARAEEMKAEVAAGLARLRARHQRAPAQSNQMELATIDKHLTNKQHNWEL